MDDEELIVRLDGVARALDLADIADAIIEDAERDGRNPLPAYVDAFTVPAGGAGGSSAECGEACPTCSAADFIIRKNPTSQRCCTRCESTWFPE